MALYFAEKFRNIVMKRHCHNARDKCCRHYVSKTGILHAQIQSKMAQNRGFSAAHTCTVLRTIGKGGGGGSKSDPAEGEVSPKQEGRPAKQQNLLRPTSGLVWKVTVKPKVLLLSQLHGGFVLTHELGAVLANPGDDPGRCRLTHM